MVSSRKTEGCTSDSETSETAATSLMLQNNAGSMKKVLAEIFKGGSTELKISINLDWILCWSLTEVKFLFFK